MSYIQDLTQIPTVKRDFMDYVEFLKSLRDLGFMFPYTKTITQVLAPVSLFKTEVPNNAPTCSLIYCDASKYGLLIQVGQNSFVKELTEIPREAELEFYKFIFEYDGWRRPEFIQESLDIFKNFEQL